MSIQAVGWVLDNERQTTGATRLVLLALANYANKAGEAWPSVRTLASDCNCSTRQVQYSLRVLCDMGVISRAGLVEDPKIRPDRRPYKYLINGVQSLHPAVSTGCKSQQNGVQIATERGEPCFTQSITEPSKNLGTRFEAKPPIGEMKAHLRKQRRSA